MYSKSKWFAALDAVLSTLDKPCATEEAIDAEMDKCAAALERQLMAMPVADRSQALKAAVAWVDDRSDADSFDVDLAAPLLRAIGQVVRKDLSDDACGIRAATALH